MKLKHYISLVCLVTLLFQVLPVKQLGSLLFSNQLQEELTHTANDAEKDVKAKMTFKKDFCCTTNFTRLSFIQSESDNYIHFATVLPATHAGEIHTPPPDIA